MAHSKLICPLGFLIFALFIFKNFPDVSAKDVVYDLTASYRELAPDGVKKQVLVVNGEFPGPTIYASRGDTLIVKFTNNITTEGVRYNTSVHWHGIEMRYNPWFDGPEGVSQCPIPFGESMEYRFTLYQAGTYWYHSHHMWQYVDGFWGLLIISNTPKELYNYDGEHSFSLMDWYHTPSADLSAAFQVVDNQPVPDNGLINGLGYYPCDLAIANGFKCQDGPQTESPKQYSVTQGKTYRIRVINTSARSQFIFSIDGHKLRTIEVDGVDTVEVAPVDNVLIWGAQRYSFLVTMDGNLDEYWIRAETVQPFDNEPNKTIPLARAILQYDRESCNGVASFGPRITTTTSEQIRSGPVGEPAGQGRPARHNVDWKQLMEESKVNGNHVKSRLLEARASISSYEYVFKPSSRSSKIQVQDISISLQSLATPPKFPTTEPEKYPIRLNASDCRPREDGEAIAPDYYDQLVELTVSFAPIPGENMALMNGIKYSSTNMPPVIFRVLKNVQVDNSSNPQYLPDLERVIQVVINTEDMDGHPWHLHGHTFWVMGTGEAGNETSLNRYDEEKHKHLLSTTGVRRDTTNTNPFSWVVIRFRSDNPGVWLLHCHINWHLEVGLGAVFIEGENEFRQLYSQIIPEEPRRICALNGIIV